MVKTEIDVPQGIAEFLDEICLGAEADIERNPLTCLAGDVDACDNLEVWFNVDIKPVAMYLVEVGAGNDIMRSKADLPREDS